MKGIGRHVKKTVTRRKNLRPQTSLRAPIIGADRNDRIPCTTRVRWLGTGTIQFRLWYPATRLCGHVNEKDTPHNVPRSGKWIASVISPGVTTSQAMLLVRDCNVYKRRWVKEMGIGEINTTPVCPINILVTRSWRNIIFVSWSSKPTSGKALTAMSCNSLLTLKPRLIVTHTNKDISSIENNTVNTDN